MRKIILSLMLMLACSVQAANKQHTFMVGDKTFLLDGKPFVVKAAEVHYPRIPQAYWEHRIKMCKALGMNTLCLCSCLLGTDGASGGEVRFHG